MIHGAKKKQPQPHRPHIAKDDLVSVERYQGLYGLCEGEIFGLADGGKSIRLDGTPLINASGQANFTDVSWEFRTGTNDQSYIKGFASVENETAVGVELRHDRPFVRAINNKDLSAVRVRLNFNALRQQHDNGDITGYGIEYAVDVQTDGGAFVQVLSTSARGKASSGFKRSHRIDLPKGKTWTIRVRRITPNRNSDLIADTMYIDALTEIIDAKLRYPNTALLALTYNAKTFSNIAKIAVRLKGKLIQVPSNYDPTARTYFGLWDGTFKLAYSNNPAWVFYDLCTHKRYGLGERLNGMVDKWRLYQIAQYCDEMVDDGMGGKEPRFTVNVYIQKCDDAYRVLQNIASVFRGLSFWDGSQIVLDSDTPKDPVYTFSPANIVGEFVYQGTRSRDRHTVAKVAWDNPEHDYATEYEMVREESAIAKYGIRTLDINAFGCTSKGQAQRAGLWALKAEQLETRTVSFKTGLMGFIPQVGQVINIADNLFAGRAISGRILSVNDKQLTLDRTAGQVGDTLTINTDGTVKTAKIVSVHGDTLTLDTAMGQADDVWAIISDDLKLMQFRVLSIVQNDDATFDITALQYERQKYDVVDNGAVVTPQPYTVLKATPIHAPKTVTITANTRTHQGQAITTLTINWEQVQGAAAYIVEWRRDDGNWQTLPKVAGQSVDIDGVYGGAYMARVRAVDSFDGESLATSSQLTAIAGKTGKPPRLANLTVQGILFGMNLSWVFNKGSEDTNFTEIEVSPDGRSNITTLGTFAYPTNKHEITGLQGNLTQFYRGRIVDKLGNASDWTAWVRGTTSADAGKVLELISGQINGSHLDQTLRTPIAKIGDLQTAVDGVNAQLPTLNSQLATANRELQTAISNITTERNRITSAIRDITALQTADNAKTQEIANLTQTVGGHTSSIRELGVTTGGLSQKYTQIKTQADNATSEITAIKQTQAGQASSIDRLGARFDNLAVGGRNLLLNTQNMTWWTWRQVDTISSNRLELTQPLFNLGMRTPYQTGLDFKDGETITLSFEYRTDLDNLSYTYLLSHESGNMGGFSPMSINNDGQWHRATTTATVRSDRLNCSILIGSTQSADGASLGKSGSYLEIRNAKLERGNIATDWTPAPEDIQSEIDAKASSASLDEFKQTSANADNALSQRISTLDTQYKKADTDLTARLAREETARANGDNANAQAIRTVESTVNGIGGRVGTSESKIATLERTTADTNQALATAQSQLNARFDSLSVGGRNLLRNTRNPTYYRWADRGTLSNTRLDFGAVDDTSVGIFTAHQNLNLKQGQDYVISFDVDTDLSRLDYNYLLTNDGNIRLLSSDIKQGRVVIKYTPSRDLNNVRLLIGGFKTAEASYLDVKNIKIETGQVATDWTPAPEDLQADIDSKASTASLDEFKRTQAQKDTATATAVQTLQTTVNGQTASIQQHAQSLNGLEAQWTLKVQSGNIVSGIGLASSNGVSDFAVRADKFYIAPPTGTAKGVSPFMVLTRPTNINGTSVPAGTYIDSAFIHRASITNAHIVNGAIDTVKIANGAIDNAKIQNGVIDNAKIANGAITTAKIGVAQVDTLQIKGEAVIVPRLQYSPHDFEFRTIDTEEEINRISIDAKGGSVSLQLSFESLTARSGGNNDGSNGKVIIRIKRNGTVLRTISLDGNMTSYTTSTGFGDNSRTTIHHYKQLKYEFVTLATLIDTPPSGTNIYTVTLESRGLNSGLSSADQAPHPVIIKARSFQILGVCR